MVQKKPEMIVALDVETLEELRALVDTLGDTVKIYKIGSQVFTSCGPAAVRFVMARGRQVFLDLKFHDIPSTVANAVRSAVGLSKAVERSIPSPGGTVPAVGNLWMYTVHTCGGVPMMYAAAQEARAAAETLGVPRPLTVGVTVLTSDAPGDNILPLVLERAAAAKKAGLDGVVASCHEAAAIRRECGKDFVIVTPGIRPAGTEAADQKRAATPREAVQSGSDYLVVGRPIVKAPDPRQAAAAILKEMSG